MKNIKLNHIAKIAISLAALSITLLCFLPILQHDFLNWDTATYITKNPYIQKFSLENLKTIFGIYIYWMPLTWLSYMLDSNYQD